MRSALDNTYEQCPTKETCAEFFNNRIDSIKTYLDSIKPDEFCSTIHLCSASSSIIRNEDNNQCAPCVQRFQSRKDAALQAVNHFSAHLSIQCATMDIADCSQLVSEMINEAVTFINEFQL